MYNVLRERLNIFGSLRYSLNTSAIEITRDENNQTRIPRRASQDELMLR